MKIPLSKPWITKEDIKVVEEVLESSKLCFGPWLSRFEEALAKIAGTKYAIALNSGTSALHLIIKALGIGEGDEAITTPFSFIASSNAILFERAKPVFVDIRKDTYNINPDLIEGAITKRTKAILAVDVFGQPADWSRLEEIAKKYNLFLIEDSCEAIGATYKGRPAGSFGNAATFAFYPNKQITTGEGGAVLTDDEHVVRLVKSLKNQGRGEGDTWLSHTRLGYNYRISDINCALGLSQLQRLDKILTLREKVAKMYTEKFKGMNEIITPYIAENTTKMSWFVYVVRLSDEFTKNDRDKVIEELSKKGIQSRNYFSPIHLQPFYVKEFDYKRGDFPVTEFISDRTISLPFYTEMKEEEVNYVVAELKEIISKLK